VIIPAVHGVVTLRPFVGNSATLSSTLEAQVTVLAAYVKANHDTNIALVGFSGTLTWANQSNEEAGATSLKLARERADAVKTLLEQQLATMGVTGYTITASGSTAALPVSSNATAASQAQNRKVVATLT
jgi:outer membrane protein OmpA-like peptidoglycan-associated protein